MNLVPLEDRIVVRPFESESKTPGGIVLPDGAKEKSQRGTVVAVGDGRVLENGGRAPVSVVEGDQVLFGKYSGGDIKIDGVDYKIMREGDILAKVV